MQFNIEVGLGVWLKPDLSIIDEPYIYRTQPGCRNAQLHFVILTKSEAENLFEWYVLDKNMPIKRFGRF